MKAPPYRGARVLLNARMDLRIQDRRVFAGHEPVTSSLDFMGDAVERVTSVVAEQVRHVLKQEYLRAIIAKFSDEPIISKKLRPRSSLKPSLAPATEKG